MKRRARLVSAWKSGNFLFAQEIDFTIEPATCSKNYRNNKEGKVKMLLKDFLLDAQRVKLEMMNLFKRCRLVLPIVGLLVSGTAYAQNADPGNLRPPDVPEKIKVEQGNKVFLVGRAVGTQNYVCKASGSGFKFVLFTPQATLFGADDDRQLIHHFFSPNPYELNTDPTVVTPALGTPGLIRATWQHSRDSSTVWAFATPDTTLTSTDSTLVEQGAVAWLKLTVSGTQDGPTGGHTLSETTFIQRLNTHGGVAPSTGCASAADVGNEAFVPYTADYFFYEKEASGTGPSH